MKAGHSQTVIAELLGVHKSAISRELKPTMGKVVTVPSKSMSLYGNGSKTNYAQGFLRIRG